MRILLITIILLPLFANAQTFITPQQIRQMQKDMPNQLDNMRMPPPVTPQTPTIKPLYRSQVENAEAKVKREEQKLIKLWRKARETEADLRTSQEELANLKNDSERSNNPNHQKSINKTEKLIAKFQDKLNDSNVKMNSISKEIKDLEIAIEESKLKIKDDY